MTTSCCPSFVHIINKHVPELSENVSTTPSPMVYTARLAKQRYPNAQMVFIGPCLAKKSEAYALNEVEMVVNFEELDAMLLAAELDPGTLKTDESEVQASKQAWGFASSGGVLNAVTSKLPDDIDFRPMVFNGIDSKALKQLKVLKKLGKFNFVEGMSCEGGCVGGCYMSVKPMVAQKRLAALKETLA